jgi:8-oxo-dGTP pyrophosphatase MutT (NUDIX family)
MAKRKKYDADQPERRYQAAGGVVIHEGYMLLLDRPGREEIRLPKGHIDPGESPDVTAIRETAEESGYGDLVILADLGNRTVIFDLDGVHFVRDEHYFLMDLASDEQVERSKTDAGQFNPMWVELNQAAEQLTFPAEQEVASLAIDRYASLNG